MGAGRKGVSGGGLEGAVGHSSQERDVVGAIIGGGQIRLPIAVEIGNRDRRGSGAGGIKHGGLHSTVAISEKDGKFVGIVIRDNEVGLAVAIEVSGADPERP